MQITHPFHPLRGKLFPLLKTRRVAGVERLTLRGSPDGSLTVPVEWTDRAPPLFCEDLTIEPPLLDFRCLLQLADLVESLDSDTQKDLTDEDS